MSFHDTWHGLLYWWDGGVPHQSIPQIDSLPPNVYFTHTKGLFAKQKFAYYNPIKTFLAVGKAPVPFLL